MLSLFVLATACSGAWAQTTPRAAPPSHAEHMQAMDRKMKAMHEGMDMMHMMMQMMMDRMPAK